MWRVIFLISSCSCFYMSFWAITHAFIIGGIAFLIGGIVGGALFLSGINFDE